MGKSKKGRNRDSLRPGELLHFMQHVQDRARTRVLPLSTPQIPDRGTSLKNHKVKMTDATQLN